MSEAKLNPPQPPGIAVVGMAGRFPGAPSVAALWRNLLDGAEGVRDFTAEEIADVGRLGLGGGDPNEPGLVTRRGVLDDVDRFDAPFFGINPREAELLDPQHRLFLEVASQALDDAGHPDEKAGPIGVFAGTSMSGYLLHHVVPHLQRRGFDAAWQMVLGNDKDHLATRVAYLLGLTGPAVLVQTACSTSLVAVHMARRALLAGECDLALAGGAAVRVPQTLPLRHQPGGITSPDGRCRPFDAAADGTVGGNGVAAVVLRRLDDALADGDTIHAVIRGSAINNDGHHKVGYTAPSVEGQSRAIRAALDEAEIDPATIGFVEGHGTGTALGDPIEVTALHRAFAVADRPASCALGSLKGNLGHLDTAAGIAGLIKAVLAVEHGVVPPTLHFDTPSPRIPWQQGPFFVPAEPTPWPQTDGPRRAGVSSFGLGGTNVHVVLEERPVTVQSPKSLGPSLSPHPPAPSPEGGRGGVGVLGETAESVATAGVAGASERKRSVPRRDEPGQNEATSKSIDSVADLGSVGVGERPEATPAVAPMTQSTLLLSAKTQTALDRTTADLANHLAEHPDLDLRNVAFTLAVGRRHHAHRRAVTAATIEEAVAASRGEHPKQVREAVVEPRGDLAADAGSVVDHWLSGGALDAETIPWPGRRIPLPPTAFDDHRFWIQATAPAPAPTAPSEPRSWRREAGAPLLGRTRSWQIVVSSEVHRPEAEALAKALGQHSDDVTLGPSSQLDGGDPASSATIYFGAGWPNDDGPGKVETLPKPTHDGPWWWLSRGQESVLGEDTGQIPTLVLGRHGHRLDLDRDLPLDSNTWQRVADELVAAEPMRRGALVGRFRWSLAPTETELRDDEDTASGSSTDTNDPGAPRDATEAALVGLWEDLLGVRPIGIHDDFFELGGHSLLATQAMARASEILGRPLGVEALFEAPTIAGLLEGAAAAPESALPPLVRHQGTDGAPLTFAQQRLWFLDRLDPGNPAYNLNSTVRLEGPLDLTALRHALAAVARRQESLRTFFELEGAELRQRLVPADAVPLPVVDLSALPEGAREREGERLAIRDKGHRFDLAHGPLWASTLVRFGPEDHELLVVLHHSIADGWSVGILLRELAELYAAEVEGRPADLPELTLQVGDVATWQRRALAEGGVAERELAYWRRQLDGLSSDQDLPTDRPRPAIQTFRAGQEAIELSAELSRALDDFARSLPGVTPFMVLLAALDVVLARQLGVAGQEPADLAVGSPVAGREHVATEALVGCFLNTLVLRVDAGGDPSFRQLVERVQRVAQGAYAHQRLPFEQLLEALQPERDLSRTPLFRVFLNLLNLPDASHSVPGLTWTPTRSPELSSKFDITVYAAPRGDRLRLVWVYNADLFDSTRISCLAGQLAALLGRTLADPDAPLSAHPLRGPGEAALLPDPSEPLDATFRGTVAELVARCATEQPGRTAVISASATWTYDTLDRRAATVARQLLDAGLQPGEGVAVWAHRSAPLVPAILGTLRAGGVFTVLDPAHPAGRLVTMLDLARPRAWIGLEAAAPVPEPIEHWLEHNSPRARLLVAADGPEPANRPVPIVSRGADDPAVITFTSGTSGESAGIKAVLGRQGSLTHFVPWQTETLELGADDRFSVLSGLAHDPLQRDLFTPLLLGAAVVVPDLGTLDSPAALVDWMARSEISVAHLTPAMGQLLTQGADDLGPRLPTLRRVFFVGDRLRRHDVARLEAMAPEVHCVNLYGSTETQRAVGWLEIPPGSSADTHRAHEVFSLGRGKPGVQLLVLDSQGRRAAVGEVGEIVVRSPHLALGYLGDPQRTAKRFVGDRYHTGDLGRTHPDGTVGFVGRADQQLKVRGFRVEPGEVEGALLALPEVAEAVVVGREDTPGDVRLVAYLVPTGDAPEPADLRRTLARQLPDAMVPSAFVVLEALPRTPNFKIDRRALPAPPRDRSASDRPYEAPRNAKEMRLARVFSELLGVERVGVHDDFFALGGHSLGLMQLVASLQEMAGVDVPLARVYREPTVAALAQAIVELQELTLPAAADLTVERSAVDEHRDPVLVPLQPSGDRPPLFLVHPGGGHLLDYRALAGELAPDQPLFGLEAPGVADDASEPLDTIAAMAERYLEAVRGEQPRGPYHLAGYCTGGLVAFEMARRLRSANEEVAWLGILDTVARRDRRDADPRWVEGVATYYFAAELGVHVTPEELRAWPPETWGDELWRVFHERAPETAERLGEPLYRRLYRAFLAIRRASWGYVPEPYDGPLALFVPRLNGDAESSEDPAATLLGWRDLVRGPIESHRVPGSHTTMLKPPQVQTLARRLRDSLERTRIPTASTAERHQEGGVDSSRER